MTHVTPITTDLDEPTFQRRGVIFTTDEVNLGDNTIRWSDAAPTVPGWYFNRPKAVWPMRQEEYTYIALYVFEAEGTGQLYALHPTGTHQILVSTMTDQWWGPLPEPTDAT